MGLLTPPVIIPYRGYGTSQKVFIKGHVLDDRLLYESQHGDKRKKNIRAMLSRYLSDAIPDLRVEITFMDQSKTVLTDDNGLFETKITLDQPLAPGWHPIKYQVLDEIVEHQEPLVATGEVLVNKQANFITVSDVDDTILISHATQSLRKLRLILTKNSKTRLPFLAVASFYNALAKNGDGLINPIFYVSSSEWNLYDFLEDFCEVRKIPKGPFMLQELKTSLWKLITSGGGSHLHKKEKILHLMDVFPEEKFILIGDSGQRDAEIYRSIASQFPERVLAIYIRDVGKKSRAKKVHKIASTIEGELEMVLVSDSFEAAQHAHSKGFISTEELKKVEKEFITQQDQPKSLVGQAVTRADN